MNHVQQCDGRGLCVQLWGAFVISTSLLGATANISWGMVACRQMQQPDEQQMQLSPAESSWLLTSLYVASAVGAALGGWLSHHTGPKTCILLSLPVTMAGFLVLYFSQHLHGLIIGRLIGGVGSVLPSCVTSLYIAGASSTRYRGGLMMIQDLFSTGATAVCVMAGQLCNWRQLALGFGLVSVLVPSLLLATVPEDPCWLMQRGHHWSALKAARKLHVLDEVWKNKLPIVDAGSVAVLSEDIGQSTPVPGHLSKCLAIKHWRCLTLAGVTVLFSVFSGYNALFSYALLYFQRAGVPASASTVFLLLCAVRAVSVAALSLLLDRFGRRTLMLASTAGMTVCYLLLLLLLLLVGHEPDSGEGGGVAALVLILTATLCYCLGLGPVTWCLIGEILPLEVRNRACGALVVLYHILTALLLITFPEILASYGQRGVYMFFGSLMAVATGCYSLVLPETKGVSLHLMDTLFVSASRGSSPRQSEPQLPPVITDSASAKGRNGDPVRQPLSEGSPPYYGSCSDDNASTQHRSTLHCQINVNKTNITIALCD